MKKTQMKGEKSLNLHLCQKLVDQKLQLLLVYAQELVKQTSEDDFCHSVGDIKIIHNPNKCTVFLTLLLWLIRTRKHLIRMKKIRCFVSYYIISQLVIMIIHAEESLSWHSPDKNINLIAPNYLPESKKENRRLAVVVGGKNDTESFIFYCDFHFRLNQNGSINMCHGRVRRQQNIQAKVDNKL